LRLLKLRPELFDERVHNERIIDGHGDLRPEHLYLLNPPVAIDCIEFSAEFRRLDVADELSFLATECDFAGAKETGQEIFNRTLSQLGDRPSAELVAFYRSYRACVRAKVAALRAAQMDVALRETALADARRHLQWADRYDRDLPGPILFVMCGLMGSGKSSVARLLAESLGAEILATDTIRRETFGASNEPAAYGQGTYTAENRRRVYDILFNRAAEHLGQGFSVILDGAFLKASLRDEALQLAQAQGLSSLVIRCTCPEEVAEVRIAARLAKGTDHSEARPELRAQQAAEQEFDPADPHLVEIDTKLPQDAQMAKLLAAL
jgi:predicted kinase